MDTAAIPVLFLSVTVDDLVVYLSLLFGISSYCTLRAAKKKRDLAPRPRITPEAPSNEQSLAISTSHQRPKKRGHLGTLDCLGATFNLLYAIFINIFRIVKALPLSATGTHPYIFDVGATVPLSAYSKMKIRAFGWSAVFVSLYVFSTILHLLKDNIKDNSITYAAIVAISAMASVIVFTCDKFILSYPSISYDLQLTVYREKISSLGLISWSALTYAIRWAWIRSASFIFLLARILLAIAISAIITIPTYIAGHREDIISSDVEIRNDTIKNNNDKYLKEMKACDEKYGKVASLITAKNDYCNAYAEYYKHSATEYLLQTGLDELKILKSTPPYTKHFSQDKEEAAGIIKQPLFIINSDGGCKIDQPFVNISFSRKTKTKILSNVANQVSKEHSEANKFLQIVHAKEKILNSCIESVQKGNLLPLYEDNKNNHSFKPDYSSVTCKPIPQDSANNGTSTQGNGNTSTSNGNTQQSISKMFSLFRDHLINLYNQPNHKLLYELLVNSPIVIVLLMFELLPVFGKLCFPPSSYEYMVAMQDLDQSIHLYFRNDFEFVAQIKNKIISIVGVDTMALFKQSFSDLDRMQKEKESEIKDALDDFHDAFSGFMIDISDFPVLASVKLTVFLWLVGNWGLYVIKKLPS